MYMFVTTTELKQPSLLISRRFGPSPWALQRVPPSTKPNVFPFVVVVINGDLFREQFRLVYEVKLTSNEGYVISPA